jgi:hypothetical protein
MRIWAESPSTDWTAGSYSVIVVSEGHAMADRAGKVQWFVVRTVEIRRRKGVLEIAV